MLVHDLFFLNKTEGFSTPLLNDNHKFSSFMTWFREEIICLGMDIF